MTAPPAAHEPGDGAADAENEENPQHGKEGLPDALRQRHLRFRLGHFRLFVLGEKHPFHPLLADFVEPFAPDFGGLAALKGNNVGIIPLRAGPPPTDDQADTDHQEARRETSCQHIAIGFEADRSAQAQERHPQPVALDQIRQEDGKQIDSQQYPEDFFQRPVAEEGQYIRLFLSGKRLIVLEAT